MSALLEARGLACARGGRRVLEGVDLRLEPGGLAVLRGPNGAGKTTLLRTLAGLQAPVAGEIEGPEEARIYAGHLDGVKTVLSVAENLAFWARIYGTRGVADALAAFDLEGLAERLAQDLSAGQRRRLGLARLAVSARRVWLLDEPTVSLDAASVARFAAILRRHCERGGAALVATHQDLGLQARQLDLSRLQAAPAPDPAGFDAAFL